MNKSLFLYISFLIFLGCTSANKDSRFANNQERQLILELHSPTEYEAIIISETPHTINIDSAVKAQPWKDITFIVLKADEQNLIELSGSLNPADGLSARFFEDGNEYISKRAPKSLDEGVELLISYLQNDGKWKKMISWE